MARADYFAVQRAIAARIANDPEIAEAGILVLIEEEVSARRDRQVVVYLDHREAPADLQGINAGRRTRMRVYYSVMCYAFSLRLAEAMERRDDLMGHVELALMAAPRTFDRDEVRTSWLVGGDFVSAKSSASFMAGGEVGLVVDLEATT